MLGLILGAGVLGVIISVMEQDGFPGWGKMIACVLAAVVPSWIINLLLPPELFFIGLLVGAACATVAIMATCHMDLKRASIASGIHLAFQLALTFVLMAMFRR